MLNLIEGPPASGKSQLAAELLESGEAAVQVDLTELWAAFAGVTRDASGRYPIRRADDPALHLARYVRMVATRQSLATGVDVVVTTTTPETAAKIRELVNEANEQLRHRTLSIPELVARERLADPVTGKLSRECEEMVRNYFR